VQHRVKRFAGGVNFFQAGFGQNTFELLLNHRNAGCREQSRLRTSAVCAAVCAISKWSSTGSNFCSSATLADWAASMRSRAARFLKFQIGGGAEQAVPMFVGLGGASLEFFKFPGREFRSGSDGSSHRRGGRRGFSRFVFGVGITVFFMRLFQAKMISSRQVRRLFGNRQLG